MVEETIEQLGHLHILVCNAGVITLSLVEALSEEAWDLTFAVNAKGVFLSCQAAIPVMKAQNGGCIINIASIAGKMGVPKQAHYCASKFAVVGFTNALAKELAPANVRVNAICPGSSALKCLNIYLRDTERARSQKRQAGNESKRILLSAALKPLRTLAN